MWWFYLVCMKNVSVVVVVPEKKKYKFHVICRFSDIYR